VTQASARPAGRPLPVQVWDSVCRHIDGIVIGSTMAALGQHGALEILAESPHTSFGVLRRRLGARAGYLNVAIRLLADQGWLSCDGEPGTDELTAAPTPVGQAVLTEYAPAYQAAARFLPLASRIEQLLAERPGASPADLGAYAALMKREWGLPQPGSSPASAQARHQVLTHLNGHLVAPVMFALSQRGTRPAGASIALGSPALRHAAQILALQGWAQFSEDQFSEDQLSEDQLSEDQLSEDRAELTAAGRVAVALATQYRYPMIYLPLLRSVPELIFGPANASGSGQRDDQSPSQRDDQSPGGAETHLDRELDVAFSGDVFASVCRTPFLDTALPLFDTEPVAAQPGLVVDMGCGDGTMLVALYQAIVARTGRGRRIGEFPLLMVGADPSPVARQVAAARLSAAGVPHVIMDGDIADPAGFDRALAALGLDARDALHVCKSAIHDRAYRPPPEPASPEPASPEPASTEPASTEPASTEPASAADLPPASSGAFARPDGSAIPAAAMARDLAGFFQGWHPLTRRYGWIVIEAHSVAAATAAGLIGRTVATALDATHGYSCQYPVEPEVFAWAARTAGFRSRRHAEPAASALGHIILTVDHFVDAEPQTR
jgi:SAM-dependent methyltransferase